MSFDRNGDAHGRDEGDALWFFTSVLTVRAGGEQTGNAWTLCELVCPPSFGRRPRSRPRGGGLLRPRYGIEFLLPSGPTRA